MSELNETFKNGNYLESDKIQSEINGFFQSIPEALSVPNVEWSYSFGFPLSFSLGVKKNNVTPKYLRVFKHFLYRYSLPESYVRSCNRLFGPIRWNENLNEWEL